MTRREDLYSLVLLCLVAVWSAALLTLSWVAWVAVGLLFPAALVLRLSLWWSAVERIALVGAASDTQ